MEREIYLSTQPVANVIGNCPCSLYMDLIVTNYRRVEKTEQDNRGETPQLFCASFSTPAIHGATFHSHVFSVL